MLSHLYSQSRQISSPRTSQHLAIVVLTVGLSMLGAIAAFSAQPSPQVVSITSSGGYGDYHSGESQVSNDGRFVLFSSEASNMVPGDKNYASDIFLRDRTTHTTTLISANLAGGVGNGWSYLPTLSSDGRYATFLSEASNLVNTDRNGQADVFLFDRITGRRDCVSVTTAGIPGNGECFAPSISRNGRYVVFVSRSSNLTVGDTNGHGDIFVRDLTLKVTTRITQNEDFGDSSTGPVITDDGNYIAYTRIEDFISRVYVVDRSNGARELVTVSGNGTASSGFTAAISSDGRYIAFVSDAANLVPDDVNESRDVFVRDRTTATTERVSINTKGDQGHIGSYLSALSADGRIVTFTSESTNLVPNDTNVFADVFLHDRQTGTTRRVNIASDGTQANQHCGASGLSASGRFVTFSTTATNLITGTPAHVASVFLVDTVPQVLRATTLTVQALSTTTFRLTWPDTNSAEAGYEIERRLAGGQFVPLTRTARDVGTFQDETAQPGTRYEYRIRAYFQSEGAPWSAVAANVT